MYRCFAEKYTADISNWQWPNLCWHLQPDLRWLYIKCDEPKPNLSMKKSIIRRNKEDIKRTKSDQSGADHQTDSKGALHFYSAQLTHIWNQSRMFIHEETITLNRDWLTNTVWTHPAAAAVKLQFSTTSVVDLRTEDEHWIVWLTVERPRPVGGDCVNQSLSLLSLFSIKMTVWILEDCKHETRPVEYHHFTIKPSITFFTQQSITW